jgi:hypothetical protein
VFCTVANDLPGCRSTGFSESNSFTLCFNAVAFALAFKMKLPKYALFPIHCFFAIRLKMALICAQMFTMLQIGIAGAAVSTIYAPNALPTANARFLRSAGNANSTNVRTWQQFKSSVELASTNNLGGVVNFEDASDRPSGTLIRPSVNNPLGFGIHGSNFFIRALSSFGDPAGPFPSGSKVLSSSTGFTLRNEFRFSGFDFSNSPGARLNEAGFTLMGDGHNDMVRDELTVTFSGGGSLTLDSDLKGSVYIQRFFYGVKAPEGEWITSIFSNFGGARIVTLDDFGFVAVPEPSLPAFVALGLLFSLRRRRAA